MQPPLHRCPPGLVPYVPSRDDDDKDDDEGERLLVCRPEAQVVGGTRELRRVLTRCTITARGREGIDAANLAVADALYEVGKAHLRGERADEAERVFAKCATFVPDPGRYRNLEAYRGRCRAHRQLVAEGLVDVGPGAREACRLLREALPDADEAVVRAYAVRMHELGYDARGALRGLPADALRELLVAKCGLREGHARVVAGLYGAPPAPTASPVARVCDGLARVLRSLLPKRLDDALCGCVREAAGGEKEEEQGGEDASCG